MGRTLNAAPVVIAALIVVGLVALPARAGQPAAAGEAAAAQSAHGAASTAAVSAPASMSGGQVPDVAGTWSLTVETSAGTGTPTVILEQDGAALSGTYKGRFGDQALTGTLDGDAIAFSFTVSGPMGSAEVIYTGTVAGAEMSGTMQMGGRAGGRFSGRRQ